MRPDDGEHGDVMQTSSVDNKVRLLDEARQKLMAAGISDEVANAVCGAASDHFSTEHQRLLAGEGVLDEAAEWEVLDSIELTECGNKAVGKAIELGVTSPEILALVNEYGMHAADFCFASEEASLSIG
ncbi:MAG: hypothetical protein WC843_04460 [Candidatus Gracilibacteria bacterium]|jgi:hypothetical protein